MVIENKFRRWKTSVASEAQRKFVDGCLSPKVALVT